MSFNAVVQHTDITVDPQLLLLEEINNVLTFLPALSGLFPESVDTKSLLLEVSPPVESSKPSLALPKTEFYIFTVALSEIEFAL